MNLKELRKSKSLTQKDAAEICNIPLRTYKRLELDEKYINTPKYNHCVDILKEYVINEDIKEKYNITIVGAGYVGLALGIMLSEKQHVNFIDVDINKIEKINNYISPIQDKELEKWLKEKELDYCASLINDDIYKNSDYIFISLPTDYDENNKSYKMDVIKYTIKEIREINKSVPIIIKSTVMVGFCDSLNDNNIYFCPEFLKEGTALKDSLYPSRIIIGTSKFDAKTKQIARILKSSIKNNASIIYMNLKEAEACKLIANTYLAMRVSFFNEIDSFLENANLDSKKVIEGVSLDPRVGDYYNNPSFGYGGYCLPKDTLVLTNQMSSDINHELVTSISKSNESRKRHIAENIINFARQRTDKNDFVIGVYSLNAKEGSDNTRNAAILDVISLLKERNINVLIYDKENMTFDEFISKSDVIITNRFKEELNIVKDKVYTRDIFRNN